MIEYMSKAVIRYLNGDFKLFEKYRNKAIEIYEKENAIPIGELIPEETKISLYEMVD